MLCNYVCVCYLTIVWFKRNLRHNKSFWMWRDKMTEVLFKLPLITDLIKSKLTPNNDMPPAEAAPRETTVQAPPTDHPVTPATNYGFNPIPGMSPGDLSVLFDSPLKQTLQAAAATTPQTPKPTTTQPQRVLDMLPMRNKLQQQQHIEALRRRIKTNAPVAVANVEEASNEDDATESVDSGCVTVEAEIEADPIDKQPQRKKQKTKAASPKKTTKKPATTPKKANTTPAPVPPPAPKPVKKAPPKDAVCKHGFTILELKDMERIDMNFYIKPGSYLEHMTCIGCNMAATTIHKNKQPLYYCLTDFRIANLDMEDDPEAEAG